MLVAVDSSVSQFDRVASRLISRAKVLRLMPEQDSLEQITQAVCRHSTQSIHIFAPSSPGCLHFSSGDITLDNLHYYAEQIESWFRYRPFYKGSTMRVQSNDYFLSLYADSLAKGAEGKAFIESFHHLSGVSIHASKKIVFDRLLDNSCRLEVSYPFPRAAETPFAAI